MNIFKHRLLLTMDGSSPMTVEYFIDSDERLVMIDHPHGDAKTGVGRIY